MKSLKELLNESLIQEKFLGEEAYLWVVATNGKTVTSDAEKKFFDVGGIAADMDQDRVSKKFLNFLGDAIWSTIGYKDLKDNEAANALIDYLDGYVLPGFTISPATTEESVTFEFYNAQNNKWDFNNGSFVGGYDKFDNKKAKVVILAIKKGSKLVGNVHWVYDVK